MKKTLLVFTGVIGVILVFMLVASYAYYVFEGATTTFNTTTYNENIDISYETSEYINVSNAIPIKDKYASTSASSNKFSISVNEIDNDDTIAEVLLSISLVNINIDDTLKNEFFRYQLLHNSEVIKEGTGLDFTSDRFEMVSKEVMYSDLPNDFIFRVWISENGLDQSSMENKTFSGSIEINAVKVRNVKNTRSIIMARDTTVAFWQDSYRTNITSIDFKDNVDVPSTAIVVDESNNYWNISDASSKGQVVAYIEDDGSGSGTYSLTIGGEGLVYANSDSSYLFNDMSSVIEINFNDCFETTLATSMNYMFYNCNSLINLDVSSFDTSKVTNMANIFNKMSSLSSLNISSFDTTNVTNMSGMFANCGNLTSLNVSNFDTSKVTNMLSMFVSCSNLTTLDLGSFNTKNVTNMMWMFSGTTKLTVIYVSSNWVTAKSSVEMFKNSGTSTLTVI